MNEDFEEANDKPDEVSDDGLGIPEPDPFDPADVDENDTRTPEDI